MVERWEEDETPFKIIDGETERTAKTFSDLIYDRKDDEESKTL